MTPNHDLRFLYFILFEEGCRFQAFIISQNKLKFVTGGKNTLMHSNKSVCCWHAVPHLSFLKLRDDHIYLWQPARKPGQRSNKATWRFTSHSTWMHHNSQAILDSDFNIYNHTRLLKLQIRASSFKLMWYGTWHLFGGHSADIKLVTEYVSSKTFCFGYPIQMSFSWIYDFQLWMRKCLHIPVPSPQRAGSHSIIHCLQSRSRICLVYQIWANSLYIHSLRWIFLFN